MVGERSRKTQHYCCISGLDHHILPMNANELKRWLKKQGCTFETHKGGSGHLTVIKGNRKSQLPMHGRKELGTGLVRAIKKDLGLD